MAKAAACPSQTRRSSLPFESSPRSSENANQAATSTRYAAPGAKTARVQTDARGSLTMTSAASAEAQASPRYRPTRFRSLHSASWSEIASRLLGHPLQPCACGSKNDAGRTPRTSSALDVCNSHSDALRRRAEPSAGVREHRMRDERRAGRVQAQADRERERGADAWVGPLGQEPRKAACREERPEAASRPAQPGHESDSR